MLVVFIETILIQEDYSASEEFGQRENSAPPAQWTGGATDFPSGADQIRPARRATVAVRNVGSVEFSEQESALIFIIKKPHYGLHSIVVLDSRNIK
jgi:hypothetical protein